MKTMIWIGCACVFLLFAYTGRSQTQEPKISQPDIDVEISKLKDQLKSAPKSATLHSQLAALLAAKQDWKTYDQEIRLAIRLDPHKMTNYWGASEVLRHRGMTRDAVEELITAVRLDPSNPFTHFLLGLMYEREKDSSRAQHEFSETRTLLKKLRAAPPTAIRRMEGDTYYDAYGNTYLLHELDRRVDQHLSRSED